jgi:RimJ/RimL family protein N-acetyltransferase
MAFGFWMEIVKGDVRLRLGPVRRDEVHRYIADDAGFGLQSYEVARYVGTSSAPSTADEESWWDRASTAADSLHWGVYVPDGDGWLLCGTTTLRFRGPDRRQARSGFLLFDRSRWGRRIASTAHLGRTLYGFRELDLLAITSEAAAANVASNRALTGVGYVRTGVHYSAGVVGGRTMDGIEYLLPNPDEEAWRYFWRRSDEEIPAEFHDARPIARRTLERADSAVTFL